MKNKVLHIITAISFIVIAQLLFFWLVPTSSETFPAVYPFYTLLTTAHTALIVYLCVKYKYPACFAPAFSGTLVTISEIVVGLLLALNCESIRTIIFVQSIITVVYILIMTLFIGIASKESVDSTIEDIPIRPYTTNSSYTPIVTPVDVPKRTPHAISIDRDSSF